MITFFLNVYLTQNSTFENNLPGSDLGGDRGLSGNKIPLDIRSSLLARTDIFLSNAEREYKL